MAKVTVIFEEAVRLAHTAARIGASGHLYKGGDMDHSMTTRALPQSKDKEVVRRALIAYASQRVGWRWKEGAFLR